MSRTIWSFERGLGRARNVAGWSRLGAATFVVLAATLLACPRVDAQDAISGSSYVTPFPDNDVYRLQVYGDSLAEGLLSGLNDAFTGDTRLQIQRSRHALNGLLRNEFDEDLRTIEGNLARLPMHIAVVMVGIYDRNSWRPPQGGRRAMVGSEEWKAEYSRRVDRLMKMFKAKNVALYWVGLPIMRRTELSDEMQMLNELVRERAYVNGQKFIDVFSQFADENGGYSNYGPDVDGKARLLREADGVHFTQAGSRKLAYFLERELRRDLNQAKAERTIPLAGSEAEQKRIRPAKAATATAGAAGTGTSVVPKASTPAAKDSKPQQGDRAGSPARSSTGDASGQGDVRADNARVTLKSMGSGGKEESVTIDIVRPAIPASILAVITRRESPDRASQIGDSITADIGGGLTVVSSVTLTGDALSGDRRRLPPTQTPYYRVLVKGERLAPKPGRADDFSWPKPEPPPIDASAFAPRPSTPIKLAPAKARRTAAPNG